MSRITRGVFKWNVFDYINVLLLAVLTIITFYPMYYVILVSLNDPNDTILGGMYLFVRKFTLENFVFFFNNKGFLDSFIISVSRTLLGASLSVLFTALFAYGMSKPYLVGRKFFITVMIITMYISGGLIPYFILIKNLGLYKNFFVFIYPLMFSAYNAIIMITYFKGIPSEIEESVLVDGGNDFTIFFRIILPISTPVIATIALFNAVHQWNSWFDAMVFGGRDLMTLQARLVEIIRDVDAAHKLASQGNMGVADLAMKGFKPNLESIKATAMVVAAVPIILVYPFLQRYFVKGIMIGSLKG